MTASTRSPDMPLLEMSPNVAEPEASRKRTHEEYAGDLGGLAPPSEEASKIAGRMESTSTDSDPTLRTPVKTGSTGPSPDSPKQAASTPSSTTPLVTSAPASTQQPAKRKKPTADEKAAKEKKDKEKEEKAKEREEKAKEKAREAKEKAEKKAAKEEEKRAKDEEKRKKQEAEERKQRSQMKLGAFFNVPKKKAEPPPISTAICTSDTNPDEPVPPLAPSKSEYERRFQPFCIYENTRLALSPFRLDSEPLRGREMALDAHIARQQNYVAEAPAPMASSKGYCYNSQTRARGISRRPIKFLMEKLLAASEGGNTEEVQRVREEISAIPMKQIAFSQDVRPPYRGTLTFQPHLLTREDMARLARNPTSRDILPLHYEYDSEAEWVDEEEGEDVDMDDDEEEIDDEDDMDGFLDDSEDHGLARAAFLGDMEPESSGLCFEDHRRQGTSSSVDRYRLEFMVPEGTLEHPHTIDPFSSQYWPSESPKAKVRFSGNKVDSMPPPAGAGPPPNSVCNPHKEPPKHIAKDQFIPKIKKTIIENKELTKASLEDILHKRVEGITKMEAKHTLVHLAEQKKEGRSKIWKLKEVD